MQLCPAVDFLAANNICSQRQQPHLISCGNLPRHLKLSKGRWTIPHYRSGDAGSDTGLHVRVCGCMAKPENGIPLTRDPGHSQQSFKPVPQAFIRKQRKIPICGSSPRPLVSRTSYLGFLAVGAASQHVQTYACRQHSIAVVCAHRVCLSFLQSNNKKRRFLSASTSLFRFSDRGVFPCCPPSCLPVRSSVLSCPCLLLCFFLHMCCSVLPPPGPAVAPHWRCCPHSSYRQQSHLLFLLLSHSTHDTMCSRSPLLPRRPWKMQNKPCPPRPE
eukprot:TRINITY_DN62074_c0_g1_i1.p1 TRINITY_DN62074_c0_g1~~TRINITY_DN62074_c0_g1_i1.p1  ORF type:complete len:318 (+),score=-72.58 TRINITY_DN62074_c0_g1_i1:140-955(+)